MLPIGTREMREGRRHRLGILILVIGVLVSGPLAGCATTTAPTPTPSPSMTPPPPRAAVEGWPDVTWADTSFQAPPTGYTSERVVAVAGSAAGYVAVGVSEAVGIERGSVWFSEDGATWARVADDVGLEGVTLVDIAATDTAFVAVGTVLGDRSAGIPTRTVTLQSADGERWERLPDDPTAPEAYAGAVAAGGGRFLMTTFTLDADGLVIRASADGRTWHTLPPDGYGDAASGISAPVWTGDGWVAAGVRFGSPVILRSAEGAGWTATRLEPPDDDGDIATDVFAGAWGSLAVGIASAGCGPMGACAGRRVAWWSTDGTTWGRTAGSDIPIEQGLVVADGDRGVVSVSGLDAWSSPDGWRWTSLGQPAMDATQVNDAVVRDNIVVAVGDTYREDATSYPTFLLAGPALVITN